MERLKTFFKRWLTSYKSDNAAIRHYRNVALAEAFISGVTLVVYWVTSWLGDQIIPTRMSDLLLMIAAFFAVLAAGSWFSATRINNKMF